LIYFGSTLIHAERKRASLLLFLAKFRNPLVIILLTASARSAFMGAAISFFCKIAERWDFHFWVSSEGKNTELTPH
jgi:hypothetical protein